MPLLVPALYALLASSTSHAPRRGKSTILEAEDEDDLEGNDLRDQEEEEDADMVRQRIKDQQKRLEELDEAQTVGLLRTQQEAGVEPPQSPTSPTAKPSWLVGLPLFGRTSRMTMMPRRAPRHEEAVSGAAGAVVGARQTNQKPRTRRARRKE